MGRALKKCELALRRKLEEGERDEEDKVAGEIDRIKRVSQRALDKILKESELRLQEDLEQKIKDAKSDFVKKLQEEKKRAKEDSERMIEEDEKELKEKLDKKIQRIREDAEHDEDLLDARRDLKEAGKKVRDKEDQLESARKRAGLARSRDDRDDSDRD